MAAEPKRRGRPPGARNKPKPGAQAMPRGRSAASNQRSAAPASKTSKPGRPNGQVSAKPPRPAEQLSMATGERAADALRPVLRCCRENGVERFDLAFGGLTASGTFMPQSVLEAVREQTLREVHVIRDGERLAFDIPANKDNGAAIPSMQDAISAALDAQPAAA